MRFSALLTRAVYPILHSQIDSFLEEIRGRVNNGSSHQLYSDQTPSSGSMDDGDPTSTNLYLGNLAPTVTEEALQVRTKYF